MAVDPKNLIAAIVPDIYCSNEMLKPGDSDNKKDKTIRDLVKRIAKSEGYLAAAEKVKLIESDYQDIIETRFKSGAFKLSGIKNPIEHHKVEYEMASQSLEPLYFWIIDWLNKEWGKSEKLVDNFVSSSGSGYFSEMQQRATRMQEEAMKIFGTANTVLRSVLNIVYDLKEFSTLLSLYDRYRKSESKDDRNAALISLKQRWLDRVDIQRAGASIKQLGISGANQPNFVTLIDAFMVANSVEQVQKMDLNDRVKRLLLQRVPEFLQWVNESERELRKRYEIEKKYLKSQVASLKLYARWIKPYLKATKDLEQRANPNSSDLVTAFNTMLFELIVMGQGKYDPMGDIAQGELPEYFKKLKLRKYSPIVISEINFRSVPDRSDQRGGFSFKGKAVVEFTSFALNDDELKIFKKELEKDDIGDLLSFIEGATEESLGEIKQDIDNFLDEDNKSKKEETKKDTSQDINPFTALFDFFKFKKSDSSSDKKDSNKLQKDSDEEKVIRSQAILDAKWNTRKLYDSFKKSLDMPAFSPVL